MIISIEYKTRGQAMAYYDWISAAGCECAWNYMGGYNNREYMIIDFVNGSDATAFRLKFGI